MLTDLMMDGSGDDGLSHSYILSVKMEHFEPYQVNTMKYVAPMVLLAPMVLQTKTTVFIIIFILRSVCSQQN